MNVSFELLRFVAAALFAGLFRVLANIVAGRVSPRSFPGAQGVALKVLLSLTGLVCVIIALYATIQPGQSIWPGVAGIAVGFELGRIYIRLLKRIQERCMPSAAEPIG
jgi:hypothetical protein